MATNRMAIQSGQPKNENKWKTTTYMSLMLCGYALSFVNLCSSSLYVCDLVLVLIRHLISTHERTARAREIKIHQLFCGTICSEHLMRLLNVKWSFWLSSHQNGEPLHFIYWTKSQIYKRRNFNSRDFFPVCWRTLNRQETLLYWTSNIWAFEMIPCWKCLKRYRVKKIR